MNIYATISKIMQSIASALSMVSSSIIMKRLNLDMMMYGAIMTIQICN